MLLLPKEGGKKKKQRLLPLNSGRPSNGLFFILKQPQKQIELI
jgi:hypothetical protein